MASKSESEARLRLEVIAAAHFQGITFASTGDLSWYLRRQSVLKAEATDTRRPSKEEQLKLFVDEIFIFRGDDGRLSPFKFERSGQRENSISPQVAARLKLDSAVNARHELYWYANISPSLSVYHSSLTSEQVQADSQESSVRLLQGERDGTPSSSRPRLASRTFGAGVEHMLRSDSLIYWSASC